MKKRILPLLLTLLLCISLFPTPASATGGACGDNVRWWWDGNDVITISGSGPMWDNAYLQWVKNRDYIKGVVIEEGVTAVGSNAFDLCYNLTSVTLPESITSIGYRAFAGCHALTTVTLPEQGLECIGQEAFHNCAALTSFAFPDTLTEIGTDAFRGCASLTKVELPGSLTSLGDFAFLGCKRVTSVTIPESLTVLGDSVFMGCEGLTSVTLPDTLTTIGDRAFASCSSLAAIDLPGRLTSIGAAAFSVTPLTSITIPEGVTALSEGLFYMCSHLERVTLPAGLTSIAPTAFQYCSGLKDICFGGTEAEWDNVSIGYANDPLAAVTVHCTDSLARASTQTIIIGDEQVTLEAYSLLDESGNAANYVKLRDLACLLNGTAAQFEVGWTDAVEITTNAPYTTNGSELSTPFSGDRAYSLYGGKTNVNGVDTPLDAFVLLDDSGGGYTYYKLRDLGEALGFNVGWSLERGIYLEPGVPYTDAD